MNLEKSAIETVVTAIIEIRQNTCAEKQIKHLMKNYDANITVDNNPCPRFSQENARKRKRPIEKWVTGDFGEEHFLSPEEKHILE